MIKSNSVLSVVMAVLVVSTSFVGLIGVSSQPAAAAPLDECKYDTSGILATLTVPYQAATCAFAGGFDGPLTELEVNQQEQELHTRAAELQSGERDATVVYDNRAEDGRYIGMSDARIAGFEGLNNGSSETVVSSR
jgi:hypothetical protein